MEKKPKKHGIFDILKIKEGYRIVVHCFRDLCAHLPSKCEDCKECKDFGISQTLTHSERKDLYNYLRKKNIKIKTNQLKKKE